MPCSASSARAAARRAARVRRWTAAAVRAAGRRPRARDASAASRSSASPSNRRLEPRQARRPQHAAEQRPPAGRPRRLATTTGRARRDEKLQQLRPHPLGRKRRSPALGDRRRKALRVERAVAEARGEAQEAQDAQIILANALARVADEAHVPRREIGKAADSSWNAPSASSDSALMVKSRRRASAREIAAEPHLGRRPSVSTSSRKRRRLERPAVDDQRDGAVRDPGRREIQARRFGACDRRLRASRWSRGRNRPAAAPSSRSRTAPPTSRVSSPSPSSSRKRARERRRRADGADRQGGRRTSRQAHSKCPGTITPFSICAGI